MTIMALLLEVHKTQVFTEFWEVGVEWLPNWSQNACVSSSLQEGIGTMMWTQSPHLIP